MLAVELLHVCLPWEGRMQRVSRWPFVALAFGGLCWVVVALVFGAAMFAEWSEVQQYTWTTTAQLALVVALFATGIGLAGVLQPLRDTQTGARLATAAMGFALLAAAVAGLGILFTFAGPLAPAPLQFVGVAGLAAAALSALLAGVVLRRAGTPWWAAGLLVLAAVVTVLPVLVVWPLGLTLPWGMVVAVPGAWALAGLGVGAGGLVGGLVPVPAVHEAERPSEPVAGRTRGLGRAAAVATAILVAGAGLLGVAAVAWPPGPEGDNEAIIAIDGARVDPASRWVSCHQLSLDLPYDDERDDRDPHLTIEEENGTAMIWLEMPMQEGEYSEVEDTTIQREAEGIESVEFTDERVHGRATLPPRFPDFTNAEPVDIEFDIRCGR